jgi:hypothetical protein
MRGYSTVSISNENQRRILCLQREISAVRRSKFEEERRGKRRGELGENRGAPRDRLVPWEKREANGGVRASSREEKEGDGLGRRI